MTKQSLRVKVMGLGLGLGFMVRVRVTDRVIHTISKAKVDEAYLYTMSTNSNYQLN